MAKDGEPHSCLVCVFVWGDPGAGRWTQPSKLAAHYLADVLPQGKDTRGSQHGELILRTKAEDRTRPGL